MRTPGQHLCRFTSEEKGLPEFQAMCDQHQQDEVAGSLMTVQSIIQFLKAMYLVFKVPSRKTFFP